MPGAPGPCGRGMGAISRRDPRAMRFIVSANGNGTGGNGGIPAQDTLLPGLIRQSFLRDGRVRVAAGQSFPADNSLREAGRQSFSRDNPLRHPETQSFSGDDRLRRVKTQSFLRVTRLRSLRNDCVLAPAALSPVKTQSVLRVPTLPGEKRQSLLRVPSRLSANFDCRARLRSEVSANPDCFLRSRSGVPPENDCVLTFPGLLPVKNDCFAAFPSGSPVGTDWFPASRSLPSPGKLCGSGGSSLKTARTESGCGERDCGIGAQARGAVKRGGAFGLRRLDAAFRFEACREAGGAGLPDGLPRSPRLAIPKAASSRRTPWAPPILPRARFPLRHEPLG